MTEINYKNIRYGMMVEVSDQDGVHRGLRVTVHGFNQKGVLVGNLYEFVPYDRIRRPFNKGVHIKFPRYFHDLKYERAFMFLFKIGSWAVTNLIKALESQMHRH